MSNVGVRQQNSGESRLIGLIEKEEARFIDSLKPIAGETVTGLGGQGSQSGGTPGNPSGNFLPLAGGQMKGPIAFTPMFIEILNNSLDVSKLGAFSGLVITGAEGAGATDQLDKIPTIDTLPGRWLEIQGTIGETLEIRHLTGGGNIRTPTGASVFLADNQTVLLVYDIIAGQWAFADSLSYSLSAGSVPPGTTENDHLEWNNTLLQWERKQILEFGVGAGLHAETGFLNFLNNSVGLAWRNSADTGDLQISVDNVNVFDFTNSANGSVSLELRAQHATEPDNLMYFTQEAGITNETYFRAPLIMNFQVGPAVTVFEYDISKITIHENLRPNGDGTLNLGVDSIARFNQIWASAFMFEAGNSMVLSTLGMDFNVNNNDYIRFFVNTVQKITMVQTLGTLHGNWELDTGDLTISGTVWPSYARFTETIDPTAVLNNAFIYAKEDASGVTDVYARLSDSSIWTLGRKPIIIAGNSQILVTDIGTGNIGVTVDGVVTVSFDPNSSTFNRDLIMDSTATNIWLGARYMRFEAMVAPSHLTATTRYLFQDSADNHLKIRTNSGLIDLESAGGGGNAISQLNSSVTVNDVGSGAINMVVDGVAVLDIVSTFASLAILLEMSADIDMNANDIVGIATLVGRDTGLDSFKIIFDGAVNSNTYIGDSATEDRINIFANGVNSVAFLDSGILMGGAINMNTNGITNVSSMTMSGDIDMNGNDIIELGPVTITGLIEDTAPNPDADFVMSYDDSAIALKKVKMSNLPKTGGYNVPHAISTNGFYSTPHVGIDAIYIEIFLPDTLYAIPFVPMETITIDQLSLHCSTIGAGTVDAWVGVYDTKTDGTNYPDQRVARWSSKIALTSTGIKNITITPTTVQLQGGKLYWLAYLQENGTTEPAISSWAGHQLIEVMHRTSSETTSANGGNHGWQVASTFSNTDMPTSFPAGATKRGDNFEHPALYLRVLSVP